MVELARLPGPSTLPCAFMPSFSRTGPLTRKPQVKLPDASFTTPNAYAVNSPPVLAKRLVSPVAMPAVRGPSTSIGTKKSGPK